MKDNPMTILNIRSNTTRKLVRTGYSSAIAEDLKTDEDNLLTRLLNNGFVRFGPYVITFRSAK